MFLNSARGWLRTLVDTCLLLCVEDMEGSSAELLPCLCSRTPCNACMGDRGQRGRRVEYRRNGHGYYALCLRTFSLCSGLDASRVLQGRESGDTQLLPQPFITSSSQRSTHKRGELNLSSSAQTLYTHPTPSPKALLTFPSIFFRSYFAVAGPL